ncbi:MAG: methyltransferase domain-containing protein [Myxococcales bacterium]|nr:methyltransferase domain-containing protein [Myxococcales bacterium]
MSSTSASQPRDFYRDADADQRVTSTLRSYLRFYRDGQDAREAEAAHQQRHTDYAEMVNQYYDLATDFYERGWGKSFHFAPRFAGESFAASLARHEHYLALRLGLRAGQTALDVGCGVGGPMRAIARFSGARVDGINNNDYQLEKLARYNQEAGLDAQCRGIKGDFMALPMADASYDAVYAVEATCHAPDRVGVFREVARVLKPGGRFAVYEWCLTDRYDASNETHRRIKRDIESGDSLPDMCSTHAILDAVRAAGLEVEDSADVAERSDPSTPWYLPLEGEGRDFTSIRRSAPGRFVNNHLIGVLEKLKVIPAGSKAVSDMLNVGADALIEGGHTGIFTPCFFVLAKKPGNASTANATNGGTRDEGAQ